MRGDHESLSSQVEKEASQEQSPTGGSPPLTPVNWRSLSDDRGPGTDPVQAALEAVAEWVDWLVDRYRLGHMVPPCWWAHGPMVEELSALYVAWNGAYRDSEASAQDGVAWHEHLGHSIKRLLGWNVERCTYGKHRPVSATHWETDLSWPPNPAEPADKSPPTSEQGIRTSSRSIKSRG